MPRIDEKVAEELSAGIHDASSVAMEQLQERVGKQTSRLRSSAKTRKSAATRERIMSAASDLMTERGNTEFQMSEVSTRCSMSKGALYYYFADKSALIEAIFDRSVDMLVDSIEEVVSQASSSMESIQGLALVLAHGIREGGPLSFAMSRELLSANQGDMLPTFETQLARVIARILGQNVDPSAINRIELGTRAVRLEEAVAAAEALDVSLTALVYGASTEELDDRIAEAVDQLSGAHRDLVDSRARVTRLRSLIQHLEEERRDLI